MLTREWPRPDWGPMLRRAAEDMRRFDLKHEIRERLAAPKLDPRRLP